MKNNSISIFRGFFCNKFILLLLFVTVFIFLHWFFTKSFLPTPDTTGLWFYSGIFMVLFSLLFIEPYYTSPKKVITNVIPLLLVFFSIQSDFKYILFWWLAIAILGTLLILSILALEIEDKNKSPEHNKNKIAGWIRNFVMFFGQGRVLYSAMFLYFLSINYSMNNFYIFTLFIMWFFVLAIDPKRVKTTFDHKGKEMDKNALGEIFSIQSRKIFLVKLFEDKKNIKKFDAVKFRYSMQEASDITIIGVVFDTYLLNQEKWAKILQLSEKKETNLKFEKNIVYKVAMDDCLIKKLGIDNLAGVIIDGSTIGKIKFEYSKKNDDLQEGDLLQLKTDNRRLFYQVVGGRTEKEKLELRNETGFIEGEAIQLGEWKDEELSFQKFGWVPSINTPVFKTTASDINVQEFNYPDYKIGMIPNTILPSIINLNDAISHHMALIGVTGAGKSFLARKIINQIKIDTKIICVDFNKEFITELSPAPVNIINNDKAKEIAKKIDIINRELEKFSNQQNKDLITSEQIKIKAILKAEIDIFLEDSDNNIAVFELPDVSNTAGILDYTKYFFKTLFEIAKEKQISGEPKKICVVLEEAHTIIPEWNFSGSSDKASQSVVNSIGQITLQGRKYGIGFLVITQRTANVSKTVLTQCNTVVCFQAFDETSFAFVGNYVGKDMVQAIPNLKQYHAVVAGKAMKSNIPVIVNLK